MAVAAERGARGRAARLATWQVVAFLQELLGQRLTAVIAGVSDAKAVSKWARQERAPHPEAEQRLRAAYQVAQLLLSTESSDTVRAWFIGMDPDLDDRAPALVIGEDSVRVLQAARNFLAHG
ncbi:MAG: XRE family transcriptional regulator [Chloroflexi bacterium]|nr:XRE family transcriptional regulator [Chloroflexota bacterium]